MPSGYVPAEFRARDAGDRGADPVIVQLAMGSGWVGTIGHDGYRLFEPGDYLVTDE